MSTRAVYRIIAAGVVCLLFHSISFADAPGEKYHVKFEDISEDALKNVIGILTLGSCPRETAVFRRYSRNGQAFAYEKDIGIDKETTPISNFGYAGEKALHSYRYPITDTSGGYLRIVYEPTENLRTWVNFEEVKQTAGASVAMFDSLESLKSFFVDIFYFTHSGKRKVYKKPERDGEFKVVSREEKRWWLQRVIDRKGEFVRIANIHMDYNTYKDTSEPIGWIRIWDDEGRLTFWIRNVDLC